LETQERVITLRHREAEKRGKERPKSTGKSACATKPKTTSRPKAASGRYKIEARSNDVADMGSSGAGTLPVVEGEKGGTIWDSFCWWTATLRGSGQADGGPYTRKKRQTQEPAGMPALQRRPKSTGRSACATEEKKRAWLVGGEGVAADFALGGAEGVVVHGFDDELALGRKNPFGEVQDFALRRAGKIKIERAD